MNYEKTLQNLIKHHSGIILTKDVEKAKIPRIYLTHFIKKGKLERISQGVYITPETFIDEMYCIQLRSNKIVFSNETALYMYELTDRDPLIYTVTVPRGYSTNRLRETGIIVSTTKKEFYSVGIITKKTIYNNNINIYSIEKTICDIIKNRNKMDKDMFYIALKRYASFKDKNLNLLIKYSKILEISNQLHQYMEGFLV